jgi:hypothetical protein
VLVQPLSHSDLVGQLPTSRHCLPPPFPRLGVDVGSCDASDVGAGSGVGCGSGVDVVVALNVGVYGGFDMKVVLVRVVGSGVMECCVTDVEYVVVVV